MAELVDAKSENTTSNLSDNIYLRIVITRSDDDKCDAGSNPAAFTN